MVVKLRVKVFCAILNLFRFKEVCMWCHFEARLAFLIPTKEGEELIQWNKQRFKIAKQAAPDRRVIIRTPSGVLRAAALEFAGEARRR